MTLDASWSRPRGYPVVERVVHTHSLEVHVTDHCNPRCAGCCVLSPLASRRFITPSALTRDLAWARGVFRPRIFKLSGGEPLLSADIVELARVAKESGIAPRVSMTTNGVPVGLFSSGGLDSTIIAGVMAEHARAHDSSPVPAYTVTFDEQASFDYARSTITGSDDTPFARDVAATFALEPRLVHVSRDEIARDLHAVAMANDALPAWEREIAQHRLARAASSSLKAVLVGDAADETHYGYHFLLDDAALRGPGAVLARLGSVPIRPDIAEDPVRDAARDLESIVETAGGRFDGDHDARVQAMTHLIVKRWLPRLLHNGDIHTMRASVEARVPFADVQLVELAARVAPAVALRNGVEKWALREAARSTVPEHVRVRKKSALPKDLRVEGVFRAEAMKLLEEPPALVDALVDTRAVRAIATRPTSLSEAERAILFRVVTLAHWSRHHEVSAP